MKRLQSLLSSESDSEEIDISKIKNKYKRQKKETVPELVRKTEKKNKLPKNQLTLDSFSKLQPDKPQTKITLDQYFLKSDIKNKTNITPNEYFSSVKKSDINKKDSLITKAENSEIVQVEKTPKVFVKSDISKKDSLITKTENCEIIQVEKTEKVFVKEQSPKFPKLTPKKSSQLNETFESPSISESKKKGYTAYLSRQGPSALGSKEIPEGKPNCLMGMTFVMTGVLESIERDDAQKLIEKYSGRVTKALSGKTTYLVCGSDPGESKIQKAKTLKTKQINEDELFELIKNSSSKNASPPKAAKRKLSEKLPNIEKSDLHSKDIKIKSETSNKIEVKENKSPVIDKCLSAKPLVIKSEKEAQKDVMNTSNILLVDKYRPTTMKQIVGQHGDRSPANKLFSWLKNWDKNYKLGFKKNEEGDNFRAVLLSGSPGIGKTTTANVVCRQLGYHIMEYDASCSRSKKDMVGVSSISKQIKSTYGDSDLKYCIIMDELDGMAGNEDRGGISELISIIKNTRCPIICICNDRQATKMRSIVNHLYDLKFRQLTLEQIKGSIKSVIFKEKIPIPDEALNEIILSLNYDMRQILNSLQMWSVDGTDDAGTLKSDARSGQKEFKLGPFDVIGRVFSHEHCKTFNDKLDLFFEDYNLGGLFVQENYPLVQPYNSRNQVNKTLKLMSLAADSIATSDVVSKKIRSNNNWELLPLQGMLGSVIPGEYLHGRLTARIQFPSWLGKFSKQNKNFRILSNLCSHLHNSTRGGVSSPAVLSMDYGQLLVDKILKPLREGDIETTISILNGLNLLREDIDSLVEVTLWPHKSDPMSNVSSQIKGMLTRAYNKGNFKVPYSIVAMKKSRLAVQSSEDFEETESIEADDDEDAKDEIEGDCMIKKSVKSKSENTSSKKPKSVKAKRPAQSKSEKTTEKKGKYK